MQTFMWILCQIVIQWMFVNSSAWFWSRSKTSFLVFGAVAAAAADIFVVNAINSTFLCSVHRSFRSALICTTLIKRKWNSYHKPKHNSFSCKTTLGCRLDVHLCMAFVFDGTVAVVDVVVVIAFFFLAGRLAGLLALWTAHIQIDSWVLHFLFVVCSVWFHFNQCIPNCNNKSRIRIVVSWTFNFGFFLLFDTIVYRCADIQRSVSHYKHLTCSSLLKLFTVLHVLLALKTQ